MRIGYLAQSRAAPAPLSPLDQPASEEGVQGARLGMVDNATTGRFTGQGFSLAIRTVAPGGDPSEAVRELAGDGARFILTDLESGPLLAAAADPGAKDLVFINVRLPDDALRAESCRPNLLHTIPSRAMLADALAQYLVTKGWRRWFLVVGAHPGDQAYAGAIRAAASKFGAQIAREKEWRFHPGSGRADSGHVTLATEIPSFTQGGDYDVLVVADQADEFGEYLVGRTERPRPVAGTQGLVATGWSPVAEQWGAVQLQNRFAKLAGRRMSAVDYAAWAAMRSIGEAAFRSRSSEAAAIAAYLRSPDFALAGFKGVGQSFRAWDGQMRQPILIAGPRLLVSVSPQQGFLHRTSELDTLGPDKDESRCLF